MAPFINVTEFEYSGAYSYEYVEWGVANCRRIHVVCGPGVVSGSGVKTLHGPDGLLGGSYTRQNGRTIRGTDLFTRRSLADPDSLRLVHQLLAAQRQQAAAATPTKFHALLDHLFRRQKLDRCYSMNIDRLEGKLSPEMLADASGPAVVQVFGDSHKVVCDGCKTTFQTAPFEQQFAEGVDVVCSICAEESDRPGARRSGRTGKPRLRPTIYPFEQVSLSFDERTQAEPPADVLLLVGMSWRVKSVEDVVKRLAESAHSAGRRVISVGLEKPSKSVWGQHIDVCIQLDPQDWAERQHSAFVAHETNPLNGVEMLESYFVPPPKNFSLGSGLGHYLWSGSPNSCSLCAKDYPEVVHPCRACHAPYCMQGPAAKEIANCVQLGKLDPTIPLDVDVDSLVREFLCPGCYVGTGYPASREQ
ncbi:hypothetical protein FRC08_014451 [Ceratobasidium sp. 394]|nr:hypothetical protein FRC08_014451 [Ceratobasidium sp. 394]KAG9100035.1 hypothetical protein FS749_016454 [Ceratobasidium sp. UAMH 11750]